MRTHCAHDEDWLPATLAAVHHQGYAVVEGVLSDVEIEETGAALYRAQAAIKEELGEARLKAAGELGVLRLMMRYEPYFFKFLEIPALLAVVDATVSETAILHLQNGFILPSYEDGAAPQVFQNRFHQDFPRVLNGYMASINTLFAISDFTAGNGGTLVVPGTHQRTNAPSADYMHRAAVAVECPAGSMIVFDSTLWHAAGMNVSGQDRLGINHQFTRSYIKQQIDYVRALGEATVTRLPARSQQLLGYYTRVVTSLDEYYRPADQRLYRAGQG